MAVDYFLKLDGIEGESQDAKHKGEIDVLNFNWAMFQEGTMGYAGGGGAGKVQISQVQVTCRMEKGVSQLMTKSSKGEHIPNGLITGRKAGGEQEEYLKVFMTQIILTNVSHSGNTGEEIPTVTLTLNFAAIKQEYCPQKPDGTLDAPAIFQWDCKQNTPTFPG